MNSELYVVALVAVLAVLYFVVPPIAGAFLKFRGKRVITCPETRKPAAVEVDAAHAGITAFLDHSDLRLKSCTRWPERKDCGQECLLQVELSPEDCLVKHMLTSWYEGENCEACGTPFGEIRWADHKPALLGPSGKSIEWSEVPAEKVPELLSTHKPICWDCHVFKRLYREYPELVVDRSALSEPVHRDHPV
jgi:hypothetical protein